MDELQDRLSRIRADRGLSLRAFAEALGERAGYETSHSSVSQYENGQTPPADYVLAVARAFSVDASWLLEGEEAGERDERIRDVGDVRHRLEDLLARMSDASAGRGGARSRSREEVGVEWESASREWNRELSPSPLVLRARERSASAGVPSAGEEVEFRRVDTGELDRRRARSRSLLRTARPHLRWLSGLLSSCPHGVYLTDEDGVVLHAEGQPDVVERWRLSPGHDWSERQMGTNGAGTALQSGRPVAVIGCEHYNDAFSEAACVGAPVRGPDGEVRGALDVATEVEFATPERLLPAVYAAWTVGRELARTEEREESADAAGGRTPRDGGAGAEGPGG